MNIYPVETTSILLSGPKAVTVTQESLVKKIVHSRQLYSILKIFGSWHRSSVAPDLKRSRSLRQLFPPTHTHTDPYSHLTSSLSHSASHSTSNHIGARYHVFTYVCHLHCYVRTRHGGLKNKTVRCSWIMLTECECVNSTTIFPSDRGRTWCAAQLYIRKKKNYRWINCVNLQWDDRVYKGFSY